MHLTRYSDYSLRVLTYLAVEEERLHTITELAALYGLSKNHLMKIVHHLSVNHYIESVRGRHGGIRLAKTPDTINLGQLLRSTEEGFLLVECFDPKNNGCIISPACRLKGIVKEALDAFLAVFDKYTLEDLISNKDDLGALYKMAAPS